MYDVPSSFSLFRTGPFFDENLQFLPPSFAVDPQLSSCPRSRSVLEQIKRLLRVHVVWKHVIMECNATHMGLWRAAIYRAVGRILQWGVGRPIQPVWPIWPAASLLRAKKMSSQGGCRKLSYTQQLVWYLKSHAVWQARIACEDDQLLGVIWSCMVWVHSNILYVLWSYYMLITIAMVLTIPKPNQYIESKMVAILVAS